MLEVDQKHIWITNPCYGGVYMVHKKSGLQGYKNRYGGSPFSRYLIHPLFLGVLGVWMTFKNVEMENPLRNGLSMSEMDPLNLKRLDFAI